jgi:hypothetical protein
VPITEGGMALRLLRGQDKEERPTPRRARNAVASKL